MSLDVVENSSIPLENASQRLTFGDPCVQRVTALAGLIIAGVGLALTLTGFGAPVGIVLMTVGFTILFIVGGYQIVKSYQEHGKWSMDRIENGEIPEFVWEGNDYCYCSGWRKVKVETCLFSKNGKYVCQPDKKTLINSRVVEVKPVETESGYQHTIVHDSLSGRFFWYVDKSTTLI